MMSTLRKTFLSLKVTKFIKYFEDMPSKIFQTMIFWLGEDGGVGGCWAHCVLLITQIPTTSA